MRCNRCGKELDIFDFQQCFYINTRLCYGSIHDGDELHYRLCSQCIDDLIAECVIDPIKEMDD